MDINTLIFVIGLILFSVFVTFYIRNINDPVSKESNSSHSDLLDYINRNELDKQKIIKQMENLEKEILKLRQEKQVQYEAVIDDFDEGDKTNNFKDILNYQSFKEKHKEIIALYHRGVSKNEIAKSLNRSIREIEMVLSLIK